MEMSKIKPPSLVLRCYAEFKGGQWQAFCLEFDLAVQGDSFEQVRQKMDAMLTEYVFDALAGEDREFAHQFMTRRAPLYHWVKFYSLAFAFRFLHLKDGLHKLFREPIRLAPIHA